MVSIIPSYTFITIIIVFSWLIFMSLMLISGLLYPSMPYKVGAYQIIKYFFVYFLVILLAICLFYWRYSRRNALINVPKVYAFVVKLLSLITPQDLIIIVLFLAITFIFWSCLIISFYTKLKTNATVLFIYYYNYKKFRAFFGHCIHMRSNFTFFLLTLVMSYTQDAKILYLTAKIWPRGLFRLERITFICLLPSLLLYDLLLNDAIIEKIFIVLPWFFLYSIFRATYTLFFSLQKYTPLTTKLYDNRKL